NLEQAFRGRAQVIPKDELLRRQRSREGNPVDPDFPERATLDEMDSWGPGGIKALTGASCHARSCHFVVTLRLAQSNEVLDRWQADVAEPTSPTSWVAALTDLRQITFHGWCCGFGVPYSQLGAPHVDELVTEAAWAPDLDAS